MAAKEQTLALADGKLLKASDVAEALNISKALAYQLIRQGKIRYVRIESAYRVRREDLESYIKQHTSP